MNFELVQRRGIRPRRAPRRIAAAPPTRRACGSGRRRVPRLGRRRVPPRGPRPARRRDAAQTTAERARRRPARAGVRRAALLGRRGRQPRVGAADCSASATRASSRRRPCTTTWSRPASGGCASASPCSAATSPTRLRAAPRVGDRRRTAPASRSRSSRQRRSATPGAAPDRCLYGYGSYEHSIEPGFVDRRGSRELDRGMIFAVAHVRGGGEMGRPVVRGRQAAAQAQHLHRLRRRARST